ncbi:methyltransferase [Streptomyces sp. NPDC088554]|uniref:methyltransferase n=1 Tax=Streptomyces sp. NPDC088554 TaxID=3365865 RepID=UPI003818C21B
MSEIRWIESGTEQSAPWHSENGTPAPRRVVIADDRTRADTAYRLASEGTALLWRGDFHNARQLLRAMGRRTDRADTRRTGRTHRPSGAPDEAVPAEAFHSYRRDRERRARILGMLLMRLEDDHTLALGRAPDVQEACAQAYGPAERPRVVSLRELLGVIGARQWRIRGVDVPALGARVHAHYGVFSPVRGEYVDLVAEAPLPDPAAGGRPRTAFEIGTGTGVLAAVLARRGIERIVATDISARAVDCARENARRLELADRIDIRHTDLFPPGRAGLVVCNPPWLPARPASSLDQGVYDPEGRMLHGFLAGLAGHLEPGGEGWLVLSDLAERLGLRTRAQLLAAFGAAGLAVAARLDIRPRHGRATDPGDPLHTARAAEVTSLWRLTVR